jgi:membrane-associated phospholipid phosphatase
VETRLLLWLHSQANFPLDVFFVFTDALGGMRCGAALVLLATVWHLRRKERSIAWTWVMLGLATYGIQEGLKLVFARPRPHLWSWFVVAPGHSFPSGHAVGSAAFLAFGAALLVRRRPSWRWPVRASAGALALAIGFGRLYLGVHWPSDVVGGWLLGACLAVAAAQWVRRCERAARLRATDSSARHADPPGSL